MNLTPLKTHKTFQGLTQFWEHDSAVTKTKMKFSTFIPEGKAKGCVIWLSGLTCTDENFITKAGAQKYLAEHQLMVICPDTSPRGLQLPGEHDTYDFGSGAGFYVDATVDGYKDHYRMYSYVNDELYSLIQKQFEVSAEHISIMGHSMGGHGALVLGLRNPGKYRSVSAFSPIVNPAQCPWGQKAFTGYLGSDASVWSQYDATELVSSGARHPAKILIDQGTQDEFLQKGQLLTQNFEGACKTAGQPYEVNYREQYDHSYYFIATFIESHIKFHASV
ncbi:S-formylglutathione hydrolase [Bdellovibrio bacteriovorus]|uniref:S-formylglutathione hydrolase n=1 Tax=Bdellovibrio bacteriovorus (strain ATCC 15356 / DSM 50701 / NCIMB 9529 / HD100) TaxID=264462 RepID=Q6MPF6_BDEBA|nr:S-formylglutathione hydrolase [Bdellovibrio bacteriovorus]CAE78842.1 Esterase D [Bdellovibrio bacteriovorus HD100]